MHRSLVLIALLAGVACGPPPGIDDDPSGFLGPGGADAGDDDENTLDSPQGDDDDSAGDDDDSAGGEA